MYVCMQSGGQRKDFPQRKVRYRYTRVAHPAIYLKNFIAHIEIVKNKVDELIFLK